jgi:hypothetical protein
LIIKILKRRDTSASVSEINSLSNFSIHAGHDSQLCDSLFSLSTMRHSCNNHLSSSAKKRHKLLHPSNRASTQFMNGDIDDDDDMLDDVASSCSNTFSRSRAKQTNYEHRRKKEDLETAGSRSSRSMSASSSSSLSSSRSSSTVSLESTASTQSSSLIFAPKQFFVYKKRIFEKKSMSEKKTQSSVKMSVRDIFSPKSCKKFARPNEIFAGVSRSAAQVAVSSFEGQTARLNSNVLDNLIKLDRTKEKQCVNGETSMRFWGFF